MPKKKQVASKKAPVVVSVVDALREVAKDVNKAFKKEIAGIASDVGLRGNVSGFVSTGSTLLDLAMRGTGFPIGRVIELYGYPGSGKSTITATAFRNCQRAGGVCALVDSESTWEDERAEALGVDMGRLLPLSAKTVEEGFNAIEETVLSLRSKPMFANVPIMIAWDTIAKAKTNSAAKAKKMEDRYQGGMIEKPKVIQEAMRRFLDMISDNRICLVIVNQLIGGPQGNTTPGGNALKFDSSMRVNTVAIERLKDDAGENGIMVKARVEKNKVSGPLPKTPEVFFPIMYEGGIDDDGSILTYLQGCGAISVGGGWNKLKIEKEEYTFRRSQFTEWMAEDKARRDHIMSLVRQNFLRRPTEAAA